MKNLSSFVAVTLLCLAGTTHAAGDAERGKLLSDTCNGCHNAGGMRNPPPNVYHVPLIHGQHAEYITNALAAYKSKQRHHKGMQALATPLSDQDIADIAAYWSGLRWEKAHGFVKGDPAAGKQKSAVCAGCHGADGNSTIPTNPKLAGQYADYLQQALSAYKAGSRKNAIMAGFAAGLSEEEMANLSAYFSSQDPKKQ